MEMHIEKYTNILSAIILILTIGTSDKINARIIHTNDFKVIQNQVQNADVETLVIFDLDDVIMYVKDQIFHTRNKEYLLKLDRELLQRMSEEEIMKLRLIAILSRQNCLVDQRIIETLRYLNQKGINTIALTHCGTGKKGAIQSREDLKIRELKDLGIDFSILNNLDDNRFPEIISKDGEPLLKSGIIFTGGAEKGEILTTVLSKMHTHPKKIIFIDDKIANIHSVENVAAKNDIEYVGIEYTAIKDDNFEKLNKERADLQFNVLEKEHKWLSDIEADEMLRSRSFVSQI